MENERRCQSYVGLPVRKNQHSVKLPIREEVRIVWGKRSVKEGYVEFANKGWVGMPVNGLVVFPSPVSLDLIVTALYNPWLLFVNTYFFMQLFLLLSYEGALWILFWLASVTEDLRRRKHLKKWITLKSHLPLYTTSKEEKEFSLCKGSYLKAVFNISGWDLFILNFILLYFCHSY